MDLRDDEPFILEVDREMVESFDAIVSCLKRTDDYADAADDEVEQELLRCLFEMWVDAEFFALSNLMDILNEHSHDRIVENHAPLLEKMGVMEGPGYRETRRSVEYLREVLRHSPDQVMYEDIRLNRHGRTVALKVVHEDI